MAEYFPLLERAVAALQDPTAEARRSIYERARAALIGQLRSMQPPVPEADILRENTALDEAVARLEAKYPPSAAPVSAPAPRAALSRPAAAPGAPASKPGALVPSPTRERPVFTPRPAMTAPPPRPAVLPTPAPPPATAPASVAPRPRPALPARTPGSAPRIDVVPASGAAPAPRVEPIGAAATSAAGEAPPPLPSAATLTVMPLLPNPPGLPAGGAALAFEDAAGGGLAVDPTPRRGREEGVRPSAPVRSLPRPRSYRVWLGAGLAGVVALGIGVTAWRLRDRPEEVLAARHAPASADAPGKISGRADPAHGDAAAIEDNAAGAPVPPPIAQGDAGVGPTTGGDAAAPAIAIQQRAAFLVDAPDDPQKVKTYVGTAIWRTESVNAGQGQPLSTAVRAELDVPDAKMKVSITLQKNPEPQLPASHTMEVKFLPQPGNVTGGIKQINVPEMRRDDEPTGTSLVGVPVAITDNNFLVGLSRGPAEAQNLRLIQERNWFDVSVLLTSGKVGKITFEKGTSGQRIIDDAVKAWQ